MRAKRAKVLLICARKYFKNAREARKVIAYYARESITNMRAKRAKHTKELLVCAIVLLVCARSARKFFCFACEARESITSVFMLVLLYKVGVEERTLFRNLFYCTRSDEHSE